MSATRRPSDRDYLVALALAPAIGAKRLALLLERLGSPPAAWSASPEAVASCRFPAPVTAGLLAWRRSTDPARLRAGLQEEGLQTVLAGEPGYPGILRAVPRHPPVLCLRGDPAALAGPAVSVVGTRKPTPYGLEVARAFAMELAASGVSVVSGLALGIDGAAHRGALEAGGRTVAVLGTGLRRLYPREHEGLAADIVSAGGAVISQFGPDTLPRKGNFIARNQVVAGLGRGVVVVEAPEGSGALTTARFASLFGRVVMAVPGPVTSPESDGCLVLLREGAVAVGSREQILASVGLAAPARSASAATGRRQAPAASEAGDGGPPGEAGTVLAAIGTGESPGFEALLSRTGLPPGRLGAALGLLEVRGFILRRPGSRYARVSDRI